jgi:aryl-alcohol dehydrogenase-like predicted oxidoreductase
MNFGRHTSEPESFAIMDRALERGVNFFDTANVYGPKQGEGITEQIIGRWFRQGGGRRERVVIATKVYGMMGEGPNEGRLSAYHIRRACEESLHRLETDHIDLYQMHHIDRRAPWEEIWQALEQLVREGKVLYVGSSNFAGWHIAQANSIAASRHFMGLASEQSLYNLAERTIELEVVPAGVLSSDKGVRRLTPYVKRALEKHRARVERYEEFCRKQAEGPAVVALAWLLSNPAVTAPIIGPRTIDQFLESLRSLEIQLSDEQRVKLDEIWPGPGGQAPEAYAW